MELPCPDALNALEAHPYHVKFCKSSCMFKIPHHSDDRHPSVLPRASYDTYRSNDSLTARVCWLLQASAASVTRVDVEAAMAADTQQLPRKSRFSTTDTQQQGSGSQTSSAMPAARTVTLHNAPSEVLPMEAECTMTAVVLQQQSR